MSAPGAGREGASGAGGPRFVVTGASGFVGGAVAARLERHGRVARASRSARPGWLRLDPADPASLAAGLEPGDVVVNCAGRADATARGPEAERGFRAANVEAVAALRDAARAAGAARLVHVSSVAAMGRLEGGPHGPDARGPLAGPYARSKREGEEELADARGLEVAIVRPTSVFGEGRGLAASLCRLASLPVAPLPDGGRARLPFTYVGNVAEAVALVASAPAAAVAGRVFLAGDDRSYELRAIVGALGAALGRAPRVLPVPGAAVRAFASLVEAAAGAAGRAPPLDRSRAHTLTRSVEYDVSDLRSAVGYRPPVDLEEAAARIAAWYREEARGTHDPDPGSDPARPAAR